MSAIGLYGVGVLVVVCGVVGFLRGWRREVVALAGLVLGWAVVLLAGQWLVGAVDRAYLMAAYTARGGFDAGDPAGLLRELRGSPPVDPARPEPLFAVVFALAVAAGYGAGARLAPAAAGATAKLLGVPVGLLNGYLTGYALLRFAAPSFLGTALNPAAEVVGQYVVPTLVAAAVLVAGVGLAAARGWLRPARPGRPPARARGRG